MARHRKNALSLLAVLLVALSAVGLAACGYSSDSKDVPEGEPVKLGGLRYNVVFSRFLNPHDNEDAAYLTGQPEAPSDAAYFGVFLEVQNKEEESHSLPDSLTITDADNQTFKAIDSASLYAFPFGDSVESQEQIPLVDSTPQQGPIEGSLVLFELPNSASESRPLILSIPGPGGPAKVTLDL